MARYALIRSADGLVINTVDWDGGPQWSPTAGHFCLLSSDADPGDTWDGASFIAPPPAIDSNVERKSLRDSAAQAIADNDAFLAIGSPSNAQILAQVRKLTQQSTRIIKRLVQVE